MALTGPTFVLAASKARVVDDFSALVEEVRKIVRAELVTTPSSTKILICCEDFDTGLFIVRDVLNEKCNIIGTIKGEVAAMSPLPSVLPDTSTEGDIVTEEFFAAFHSVCLIHFDVPTRRKVFHCRFAPFKRYFASFYDRDKSSRIKTYVLLAKDNAYSKFTSNWIGPLLEDCVRRSGDQPGWEESVLWSPRPGTTIQWPLCTQQKETGRCTVRSCYVSNAHENSLTSVLNLFSSEVPGVTNATSSTRCTRLSIPTLRATLTTFSGR